MEYMRRGWEPSAVLNWLALAGWGVQQSDASTPTTGSTAAPDSTAVMSISEMIENVSSSTLYSEQQLIITVRLIITYTPSNHIGSVQVGVLEQASSYAGMVTTRGI